MNINQFFQREDAEFHKALFKVVDFKGGSAPQIDYGAIHRAQEQERQRLQAQREEEFRVSGIRDYINYMYDNPEQLTQRAATGQYFKAISPGKVPTDLLKTYGQDKTIKLSGIKADQMKYFQHRTSVPSVKEGRIRFGKRSDKPIDRRGLLGGGEVEKKQLLGA